MKRQLQKALALLLLSSILFSYTNIVVESPHAAGLYVTTQQLNGAENLPDLSVLDVPGVDGILIRVPWNKVETAKGVYDFSLLDTILAKAVLNNKKIALGIIAGIYAPEFISRKQLDYQMFNISQQGSCDNTARDAKIYLPWAPVYIDAYLNLMRNARDYFVSKGAINNLKIVKMSAIAQQTLELRLPRLWGGTQRGKDGVECEISNGNAIWAAAGYRPSLVVNAYSQIMQGLISLFPNQAISQALLEVQGFPAIREDGSVIPELLYNNGNPLNSITTGDDIVKEGIRLLGKKYFVQNTNLSTFSTPANVSDRLEEARIAGASLGWQTNIWFDRGIGCRDQETKDEKAHECTDIEYQQSLQNGVDTNGKFIEIWVKDVLNPNFNKYLPDISAKLKD